jgi:hypothetical protein
MAYMVALVLALGTLFFVGSKKETMLLNINRTSELYSFGDTKKEVKNSYTFLFTNTDSVEHEFYFEVMDDRFSIVRPSKPVLLKSGEKIKDIVVIKTDKEIVSDDRRDTPVNIKIRAFAVDKPKDVSVIRDTVFMYPSLQVINSK